MELLDEAIEETTPQAGKQGVYFYYRFQRGHPAINVRTRAGDTERRDLKREDLVPDQSVLAQRKDPEQYPEVTWVGLMPVGARRELMNLEDDVWTKVNIEFYRDAQDGVFKVLE